MSALTDLSPATSASTLGDVLYARPRPLPAEHEWTVLIQAIAAGDPIALNALYERAHCIVFTLMMRMTANREIAEELTLDVFYDVWRKAGEYQPDGGSVIGWVMNQARSRAIDRLRFESRKKRRPDAEFHPEAEPAADPHDVLELREQAERVRRALGALTSDEQRAIETTFFGGQTHAEAAAHLGWPLGTVKTRVRSGLHKLRSALAVHP